MTVAELMTQLAAADPDGDVCCGPSLRLLADVHVENGVPGAILPYVVLLPQERA